MSMSDKWPVLRLRASGPSTVNVEELSIDGVDLLPFCVRSISIDLRPQEITTATITVEVVPDIELPAEIAAHVVDPLADPPPNPFAGGAVTVKVHPGATPSPKMGEEIARHLEAYLAGGGQVRGVNS